MTFTESVQGLYWTFTCTQKTTETYFVLRLGHTSSCPPVSMVMAQQEHRGTHGQARWPRQASAVSAAAAPGLALRKAQ